MSTTVPTPTRPRAGRVLRFFPVLGWLWFAWVMPYCTNPSWPFDVQLAQLGSAMLLGLVWLVLFCAIREHLPAQRRFAQLLWWLSAPFALALASYLAFSGRGVALRLALYESAVRAYVDRVPPGTRDEPAARVGLFWVEQTWEYEGAVFLFTGQGFIDSHGIAYIPQGKGCPRRILAYPLYGDWYEFTWHF